MYKEELLITQFSAKELQEIGVIEEIMDIDESCRF